MALMKAIKRDDGVVTNYHRILFIQTTINRQNSIAVLSYVDEESRLTESVEVRPYKVAVTYETAYSETMTVEDAYNYLKTLPDFEGAEDI